MSTAHVSTAQAAWLVAERDIVSKLRSKSFIISTVLLLLVAIGGVIAVGVMSSASSGTPIAVTADAEGLIPETEALEITPVADREAGEMLVRDGDVDALVVADGRSATGLEVVALEQAPSDVVSLLSVPPSVTLLDDAAVPSGLRYILGLIFSVLFMGLTLTFAMPIATAVVEEKQTRVIEILISTVSARALLAGKVLAGLIIALGQVALLAATGIVGFAVSGQSELVGDIGAPIAWFAVFLGFGFVLMSAMFAAAGSMVSRQEDISPTLMPVMYLVMIPYMLVIIFGDNRPLMTILSYVPFSSPIAMPVRLFFDEAAWWEPLASLAVMVATCVVIIAIGARIYENSLLKMGARVKLADALKR